MSSAATDGPPELAHRRCTGQVDVIGARETAADGEDRKGRPRAPDSGGLW